MMNFNSKQKSLIFIFLLFIVIYSIVNWKPIQNPVIYKKAQAINISNKDNILDINITIDKEAFYILYLIYPYNIGKIEEDNVNIGHNNNITLGLTITPFNMKQTDWRYFKESDKNIYPDNARILEHKDNFNTIFSFSKDVYDFIATAPNGTNGKYKRIATVKLQKGKYNIKLEFLNSMALEAKDIIYLEIEEMQKERFFRF